MFEVDEKILFFLSSRGPSIKIEVRSMVLKQSHANRPGAAQPVHIEYVFDEDII